jgi:hypothetical protein
MPFAARQWNLAAISAATIAPREISDHPIPPARTGSIEVRPVRPIRETVARATMGR